MEDQLNEILNTDGCPKCGSNNVVSVKYTWWGGVIGPKVLHHTRCKDCRHVYNSKTRESNTKRIVIYCIVVFVVCFLVFFFLRGA